MSCDCFSPSVLGCFIPRRSTKMTTTTTKNASGQNTNNNSSKDESPLIVAFGEMLIDFVPNVAGVSLADSMGFLKAPGGAPANVAVAIRKLGGRSAFIGKFGEDEFGYMLVDILKKNEVITDGVCFDSNARTALAFVTLRDDGEREFMFYRNPSADMLLKESELNMGLIQKARIFHYGSISLISEPCRSAHMAAMEAAKQAGLLLSYDPNVRLPLWPSADAAKEGIKSIWKEADIIKVSDDEVAFLTNEDQTKEEVVRKLWFDGLKLLVVTDGEKGCRYFTKKFKGSVSGFSVKTIDTTGAGDSFVGSILTAISKDASLLEDENKLKNALRFANACGAICTTQKGAIPALPDVAMISVEDGLGPEEGYKPWSAALDDGNAIMGPTFSSQDCEVLMMVGLPASGKTTWAENWVKEHPEKHYVLLGTNLALDQTKVNPGYSRFGSYGKAEFSSEGCRSASGNHGPFNSRDGPFGSHSYYVSHLPRHELDRNVSYGGYDPYGRPNVESRNLTPGGDMGSYPAYSGSNINSRPNFESRSSLSAPATNADSYRSCSVNDCYGTPGLKNPSSFRQPDFVSQASSFSYGSPDMHMGESRNPLVDVHGPRVPPLEPRCPPSAPYGSHHGVPPPWSSYRTPPPTQQWHADG
ncbi:hypothetical protein MRB53_024116 [Persea americana]|uniref:Uncharacterized protein n=1 Tax=Persea americana TaxID=3435 RepID=A0ACC2LCI0_PERAE|nr:hypothetical protein MRB53_024116 [Persea americana]